MAGLIIDEINSMRVENGQLHFWWLGQQSWVIKTARSIIYIDPYLTPREKRNTPPFFTPEQMINADYIFGTHDHSDHIDHPSIAGMMNASPNAKLITPEVARQKLLDEGLESSRIISLGRHMEFSDDRIKVTALKAKHEFFDFSRVTGFPFLQYIIELDGVVVYTAGDTLCYDGLQMELSQWPITLALVPINGRDAKRYLRGCMGNMTWQEAVDLAGELHPVLVCPAHYEMFSDNSEDPQKFVDYLEAKFPDQQCWVGMPGDGALVSG